MGGNLHYLKSLEELDDDVDGDVMVLERELTLLFHKSEQKDMFGLQIKHSGEEKILWVFVFVFAGRCYCQFAIAKYSSIGYSRYYFS